MKPSQTIAITGASRGIGASAAIALAAPGRRLILLARSIDGLRRTRQAVLDRGGDAVILSVDLSSRDGARDAARQILQHAPELDVLLLNAGTSNARPFLSTALDDVEYELRLNYLSPVTMLREILPKMKARGGGQVICVGSLASLTPFPGESTYSASKAALFSLFRTLRLEMAETDISFTMVLPGLTETEMTAEHQSLLPAMSPARVADAIVNAVRRPSPVVIPGRLNRLVARMFQTFPGLTDRLLGLSGNLLVPTVPNP
ncbi:MAG: SDR family NAD(P)-dependent oxidoreductase [Myxococcota bacterium]